jgi:uncharacterized protein with PIN domain
VPWLASRARAGTPYRPYETPDPGDPALAARSARERRILLSRDRGLLRRRELWAGAFVHSDRPAEQLRDVLSRFTPVLAPWTRCTARNGRLRPADKETVRARLEPGTEQTYDTFAQCETCARVYWPGAHHDRLTRIVTTTLRELGTP